MNAFLLTCVGLCSLASSGQETLGVQVSVSDRVYFVGQGIEIRVGVVAAGTRPRLVVPRSREFTPELIREEFRQLTSSGIGAQVTEQNLYISRFRIVPRSPGSFTIPAFRATLGDRSGASQPFSLTIKPLPPGRPAGFLGSVGKLTLNAEAIPASVRVGQELEFRLTLTGPGARGAVEPPDLRSIQDLPMKAKVETLPPESVDDPPRRTLRYRIRPTKEGEYRLPAVTVAWLDPTSERYMTVKSNSIPIRVTDVAEFDTSKLAATVEDPKQEHLDRWPFLMSISVFLLMVVGLLMRRWMRYRPRQAESPWSWDHSLSEIRSASDADLPSTVIRALWSRTAVEFSTHEAGEPTPRELAERLGDRISDATLKNLVIGLAEACDRARFSGRSVDFAALREQAETILAAMKAGEKR